MKIKISKKRGNRKEGVNLIIEVLEKDVIPKGNRKLLNRRNFYKQHLTSLGFSHVRGKYVPEEYWQEVYIIEKIPDDLNWDNIVKDYRWQSRGDEPMKLPTRARLLYDEADHRAYEWEKEENPERFTDWRNLQAGHIDPKQFRLALMSLGTSLEELKEMDHEDTPEIDEL